MTVKQRLIVLAGLAISAFFLYIAFRDLDPASVLEHIQEANLPLIIFAGLWYFTGVAMISKRWRYLLRAVKPIPTVRLIPLTFIGYMGNNVYPLRAGEILRLILLQRREGVPFARGAVVTLVERIFDGLVLLTFVVVSLALLENTDEQLRAVATTTAPIFLVGLVIFFAIAANQTLMRRLISRVAAILPGRIANIVSHLGDEVLVGMSGLRSPADLVGTIITSYLTWALKGSAFWLVALAFSIPMDFTTALLAVGIVNLVGLVPASPGQLGLFETFTILVLTSTGVERELSQAYALVVHLVVWLPVTVVGFYFLARQGLGWNAVTRAREGAALEEQKATA